MQSVSALRRIACRVNRVLVHDDLGIRADLANTLGNLIADGVGGFQGLLSIKFKVQLDEAIGPCGSGFQVMYTKHARFLLRGVQNVVT